MSIEMIWACAASARERALWIPLGIGACYFATLGGLSMTGIHPKVPWDLFVGLVMTAMPFACCAVWTARRANFRSGTLANMVCMMSGILGLYLYQMYAARGLGAVCLVYLNRKSLTRPRIVATGVAAISMLLFYATIFNCNYLLARLTTHRRHDLELAAIDCWLYSLMRGHPVSYASVFPLFRNTSIFGLFENAYVILFAEIMLTGLLVAVSPSRRDLPRFFAVLGTAYLTGLLIFAVFPAVGPPIAFPGSLAPEFHNTITYQMMSGELAEFQALMRGSVINGLGYFVAMPSLHVLASIILQGFLRRSSILFWAFLPINAAVVCSTVVLGQHYIADLVAGLALGMLLWPHTDVQPLSVGEAEQESQERLGTVVRVEQVQFTL